MTDTAKTPRTVNKLTIEITDMDAVLAAYPAVEKVITQRSIDRTKLRPIVVALHAVGVPVPGVKAYYSKDLPEEEVEITGDAAIKKII